jgi:oligoendopeptidase F
MRREKKKQSKEMRYVFVSLPANFDSSSEGKEKWEGSLNSFKSLVNNQISFIKKDIGELSNKLEELTEKQGRALNLIEKFSEDKRKGDPEIMKKESVVWS